MMSKSFLNYFIEFVILKNIYLKANFDYFWQLAFEISEFLCLDFWHFFDAILIMPQKKECIQKNV